MQFQLNLLIYSSVLYPNFWMKLNQCKHYLRLYSISDYFVCFLNKYNLEAICTLNFCMVCYEIGQKPSDYPILILFQDPSTFYMVVVYKLGVWAFKEVASFLGWKGLIEISLVTCSVLTNRTISNAVLMLSAKPPMLQLGWWGVWMYDESKKPRHTRWSSSPIWH